MKVQELIKGGESERVEFKERFGKEVIQTVGALANTYGGYVLIRGKTGIERARKGQITIKYFCENINPAIEKLLEKIKEKHEINFEIVQNKSWKKGKDKEIYEKYFKPRARILRKRTGKPITKLKSRKARHYFVSIPGTIALFVGDNLEYWEFATEEGIRFLEEVLGNGEERVNEMLKVVK